MAVLEPIYFLFLDRNASQSDVLHFLWDGRMNDCVWSAVDIKKKSEDNEKEKETVSGMSEFEVSLLTAAQTLSSESRVLRVT